MGSAYDGSGDLAGAIDQAEGHLVVAGFGEEASVGRFRYQGPEFVSSGTIIFQKIKNRHSRFQPDRPVHRS